MLSSLSIVFLFLWLIVVAIFSYSAYWAFVIRRALQQGLYRKQALWVGLMAIYFVVLSTFLTFALTFSIDILPVNILGGAIISSGFIVIFLWIDSTIRVARRSDPLSRDALRWSKLRYLWGFITIGGAIGAMAPSITSGFSTVAPFGGALFVGAVALIISARRSRDATLRRHLKWTAFCIFLLWLGSQVEQPLSRAISDANLVQAATLTLVAVGAYCLYRSARSLVPLGHISKLDTITTSSSVP